MNLKIVSTNGVLFNGEVEEVIVPTLSGETGILPGHTLYSAVLKGGVCKIKVKDENDNLISKGDYKIISIGEGVVYTNGKEVRIATSEANSRIEYSDEELEEMKSKLEKEIEEIKAKGSIEEIEKSLFKMNKLLADIELKKLVK